MTQSVKERFLALNTRGTYASLRIVETHSELISVRQGVVEPLSQSVDLGAMLTVICDGAAGYAATSDLSELGLQHAFERAYAWANACKGNMLFDFRQLGQAETARQLNPVGHYEGPGVNAHDPWTRKAIIELLLAETSASRADSRIVDAAASVERILVWQRFLTKHGGDVEQRFSFVIPNLRATAFDGAVAQTRSFGGQYNGYCQQGNTQILDRSAFQGAGKRIAEEALELLLAPNCPSGPRDLLLLPEQMLLQIHESIGHPLELDRILGDERNYAGRSFVSLDMFGHYQYGSELLNVSYDPSLPQEFASFGWDDDGTPSKKTVLIANGILQSPLGGSISQARAELGGVATSRASNWNRPPIDRMSNLNLEPGQSRLDDMIASVERGILMNTNVSWSIDDSRNKFQFGCEWGRLIENGKLGSVVKNSNYRGISATFWRSLKAVGDENTFELMGTPSCGKGEPNQLVRVGHASPACLFGNVEVFGGEG